MAEPCVSIAMIGNKWWFDVFRLSPDRGYQTVVRGCPRRAGREWDSSWKFGHTNPFGSFACLRIRRDSHRHSIQDQCGGSRRSPGLDCMESRAKDPWVAPWQEVLISPGTARDA